ncbi:CocE/NonD family hydrolase [Mucilaginibacter rubeus]|uniref:CocE/NonD family hydrolase n=1 Tax=Mucilaginibacter rubeus TaxID=2027860 RepID=A0AAE6MLE3_9SPHI|nr:MULTISPECIES: CocE/NonD family hydrolase [Mucilaginibacter]QEM07773.1 CocE/NonD family hydrolase [Mucilaginibacter rubeus]QEM20226.1 CocE/NonD family hydrolase [Mucilaginibacter gossypii]QTE43057.1 CocE/NonD family hydrolase [Mucilaginibacter rubeus]QTE49658.1 CocE/NonD family hydrolase [Mucilaginibacter rubeus]QTE54753.1 CocE/NonD family hydrolase [Mucilaginibacter rubeus]
MKKINLLFVLVLLYAGVNAQSNYVKEHFTKKEVYITMRDGVKLFTSIYTPKDASSQNKYPMMMMRTCYSIAPYGEDKYPQRLGPSEIMMKEGYIFVYQDVRGRWKSEGNWTNMTPVIDNKKSKKDVDEGSDTYDTIDWLVKNVANNNGKVGQYGISYPGFYTAAGILSNHPALKASSPQAPISDFFFDDFHHNGAFIEGYFFTFPVFGVQKTDTTSKAWYSMLKPDSKDGYQYLLDLGPLKNADKFYHDNFFWQETINHPNYDEFWQKRGLLKHYGKVKPAVMLVGGWFDAEDLTGPLAIYKTINKTDPNAYNTIVMGPFGHGRWSRETGHTMHSNVYFGDSIATFYQKNIEAKFFNHFLKGKGDKKSGLPNAYMFNTGKKKWATFDKWPAANAVHEKMFLGADGKLVNTQPVTQGSVSYISDPLKPVPYTEDNTTTMGFTPHNYMSEDQRFAGRRPDVLVYQSEVLNDDVTLGGEIMAHLKIATTGTDADFVVKLIDVYPADEPNNPYMPNKNIILSNYWQMVRSEVMPARFRNSFEKPEALVANQKTDVNFRLQDVLHTFKKGHRIMIQVQSTWFPIVARNPQKFVENPYKADESDYIKATETVYNDSYIDVQVLK